MFTRLRMLALISAGAVLSASFTLVPGSASALTLTFDNTTSESSNNPFTGASAAVSLTFSDVTGGVGVAGSIKNTTGETTFGAGATAATLTGFGLDLLSGWSYIANSFVGGSALDTLILAANFQPFGTLDVAAADNSNFNGGNANGGLTTGNTDTFSFSLFSGMGSTAAQLEAAMDAAFAAGTLQAGLRFQQVNAGAGSDKLNYTGTTTTTSPVPVPAAGLLLLGALGGIAGLRRRRKSRA